MELAHLIILTFELLQAERFFLTLVFSSFFLSHVPKTCITYICVYIYVYIILCLLLSFILWFLYSSY